MKEHFIETRQLRHVIMLAKHRNFRKAADALFITQPALTKSIRNLESQLDQALFDRKSQSVDPTPHCEVLLQHAHRVLQELEAARHSLDSMSTVLQGVLHVGSGPVIADGPVALAISGLMVEHPRVSVKITIESWWELASLLRQGRIQLFVADVAELRNQADLEIITLRSVSSVFACRIGHPLAKRGYILPEDLLQYPLATPRLPERYQKWLYDHAPQGMNPESYVEQVCRLTCESFPLLKTLVHATDLITSGHHGMFAAEFASGELIELTFEGFSDIKIDAGVVYLKDTTLPPVARALISQLVPGKVP
ncbi:LysR family transcriptional regulator [Parahaliea aestuarii]|uniref:LysR family transcriptional regulator n=1 Tax=Parahaliea aestuarii TaxID=1852021 RepID=A0A5C8ZN57_9GAMM|nr:LysR family transcriptional regulator [Parahaliea aestuarii]TXS89194.1 LysR family transcriptional regulator [Parahaliea aestuarii]